MMETRFRLRLFAIIMALIACFAFAQELPTDPRWFTVTGSASMEAMGKADAMTLAKQRAEASALDSVASLVESASMLRQTSLSLRDQSDNFAQLIRVSTRGTIIKRELLGEKVELINNVPQVVVRMRVQVKSDVQPPDPTFRIEVSGLAPVYRVGDELQFTVTSPNHDGFLTILNLYGNDSLRVLLPSSSFSNQLVRGKPMTFPPPQSGLACDVSLLPGKDRDQESLIIIATKRDVRFPIHDRRVIDGVIATGDAFNLLHRWLADIPANERTFELTTYTIVKK